MGASAQCAEGGATGVGREYVVYTSFYVAAVVKPPCICFSSLPSLGAGSHDPDWSGGFLWREDSSVSNDLLSVRALSPVTRFSMRLATRAGRPVGGDPIYPTACFMGPEV